MNKNWLSYIGTMALIFAIIAFFGSDMSVVIGAVIFAFAGIGMPTGLIVTLALICMGIFALFIEDILFSLILSLGFIIPGILMGRLIRKKAPLSIIIGSGTLLRFIFAVLTQYRLSVAANTTIKNLWINQLGEAFKVTFENSGYGEDVSKLLDNMLEFTSELIPSMLIISSLGFVFLTLLGTKFMGRRIPGLFSGIRRLRDIKMDISVTVFSIILFLATLFVPLEFLMILFNLIYVLGTIYLYAGIAFIIRILNKVIKSNAASVIITGLIGVFSFGVIYIAAGLIGSFVPIKAEIKKDINEETNLPERKI